MTPVDGAATPGVVTMSGTLSQAEYAARIGTSRQYVHKMIRAGKITAEPDGRIDPLKADAALNGIADPARTLVGDDPPLAGDPPVSEKPEAPVSGGLSFPRRGRNASGTRPN